MEFLKSRCVGRNFFSPTPLKSYGVTNYGENVLNFAGLVFYLLSFKVSFYYFICVINIKKSDKKIMQKFQYNTFIYNERLMLSVL